MQVLTGGQTLVAAGACVAAVVAAAPAVSRKDLPTAWRVASRVLLVGAVLTVLTATLLDTTSGQRILNLQPGAGIAAAFDSSRGAGGNILGNVALFVPLGFLWAAVSGWSVWKVTASGVALSVLIEAAQYLTARRWADVDDVLLNGVGAGLGAAAYVVVSGRVRGRSETRAGRADPGTSPAGSRE